MGVESTTITAGLGGFLVLFGLALACWFLFRSMNKHLRGVNYREEQQAAQQAANDKKPLNQTDVQQDNDVSP